MEKITKILILLILIAIAIPLVYAQKVLDWAPSHQTDNQAPNIFSATSTYIANIGLALQPYFFQKNNIPPKEDSKPTPTPPVKKFEVPPKPYRFLLVGDSSMAVSGGFGDILEQKLISYADTFVVRDGKVSSGLSRPDYFNWNTQAAADVAAHAPNIAVVMIGDNDAQGFSIFADGKKQDIAYGTARWDEEYQKRVRDFASIFTSRDIIVYWVGLPAMRDPGFAARIEHVNELQMKALMGDGLVKFISGQDLMAGKNKYEPFMPDEQGIMRATRNADGIHLSYFGGTILTDKIIVKLKQDIDLEIKNGN